MSIEIGHTRTRPLRQVCRLDRHGGQLLACYSDVLRITWGDVGGLSGYA
jgi:hypothetical protein